ncbi:MAG: hypothetical protein JOZ54_12070 [Acidobacteria bacterium]|nr:hypothetical protein [Acidobacteriota bacterium]
MTNRFGAFIALVLLFTAPALAQATARQGEATSQTDDHQRFRSPMIVEIPLHVVDPDTWGVGPVRGSDDHVELFVCEGVFIRDVAVSGDRMRGSKLRIRFHLIVANERGGVDKLVDLRVELMRGDTALAKTTVKDIDVEEGRVVERNVELVAGQNEITPRPRPTVRLTVAVITNN